MQLLERDIFPTLGRRPIAEITPPELLAALRPIQEREALDTAHRARGTCGQIFRYAVATGRAPRDPAADLRGALPPVIGGHFAAALDPDAVGRLLVLADAYATTGSSIVAGAMRLAPLVFVRPGELRRLQWSDLDLAAAEWRLIVSKSKKTADRRELIVPLSTQAVAIIEGMRPETGDAPYVFPSFRSKLRPMSEGAILAAYRRCGVTGDEMTGHGWRAVARTFLDEKLKFRVDIIEAQLGHAVRDPNGRAYNRTTFLDERRAMMQAWADHLDGLRRRTLDQREARR
jgi:integrase